MYKRQAHHRYEAAPGGDLARAADTLKRAGDQAIAMLAWEEAAQQYARARELRDSPALALDHGDALNRAGATEEAQRIFAGVVTDDPDEFVRAALGHGGIGLVIAEPDPGTVSLLERALAAQPDNPRLLGRLAIELYYADPERSRYLGDQAVATAKQTGRDLGYALHARHVVLWTPDDLAERFTVVEEMLALAASCADRELALQALNWKAVDLFDAGEGAAFDAVVDEHAALADELRLAAYQWYTPLWRGVQAMLAGRFADADRLAAEAMVMGIGAGDRNAWLFCEMLRLQTMLCRGRFSEADLEVMRAQARDSPVSDAWRCGLAWYLAELGYADEAREHLEYLGGKGFGSIPRDMNWMTTLSECAETAALLGDTRWAGELYDLLAPFADRPVTSGRAVFIEGTGHRSLALLAALQGDYDLAVSHFEQALALGERQEMAGMRVRTQAHFAAVLRAKGDDDRAATLEAQVRDTSARLGIDPIRVPRLA